METITFSSSKKLEKHLRQSYTAESQLLTISVLHTFGFSRSGALKVTRRNTLNVYDWILNKNEFGTFKIQAVVGSITLTNKLFNSLKNQLAIELPLHRDTVANFCYALTPLKRKLQNFLAHLNEPDTVEIAHPVAEAL